MEIYNSDYSVIKLPENEKCLLSSWKPKSSELDEDGVKKEMLLLLDYVKEHSPFGIMVDTRDFRYEINQKLQDWIVKHLIAEIIDLGVSKYAIIVTEENYRFVSRELIEEETFEDFSIQYFTDQNKAWSWLKD